MEHNSLNVKKFKYRLKVFIGTIPSATLKSEKQALAESMGIGEPQLRRLIREDSEPSGSQLKAFADYFNVSVDELYEREEEDLTTLSREMVGA